jgi:hypothetical protein
VVSISRFTVAGAGEQQFDAAKTLGAGHSLTFIVKSN